MTKAVKEIKEKVEEVKSLSTKVVPSVKITKEEKKFDEINAKIQTQINEALTGFEISTVEFLDDSTTVKDFIDTGWDSFNLAITGNMDNGYPVGRISEISGDPSTGKTLLATMAAVKALQKGFVVYYIDTEQAYDVNFAKLIARTMGLNPELVKKINYIETDKIEELSTTVTTIINILEKNKIDTGCLIVIDSLAFLTTNKEMDDVMGNKDSVDMTKAKKIRQFIRVVKNKIKHLKTSILFTNQLTHNIGQMFGEKKVTTGGTAVPFASSVRVELNSKKITVGSAYRFVGLQMGARCKKSRLTTPYKKATFPIFFNGQFDRSNGLFELLKNEEIVGKQSAQIYKIGDITFKKKEFKTKVYDTEEGQKAMKEAIQFAKDNPKEVDLTEEQKIEKMDDSEG